MTGEIGILNVGAGDTKISFDKSKPAERKKAAKVVADMLKRGFVILIDVGCDKKGPLYRRVEKFDPKTCEYIIAGIPEDIDEKVPARPTAAKRRKGKTAYAVDASSTSGIAVARSAGG